MTVIVRAALAAGIAALLGALTSCSSGATPHDPGSSVKLDQSLHDGLPAAIRASGVIHVVTDASYAPASSFAPDGRTIIGFEPDLGTAIGKVLGVRVVFRNADFSTLPALVRAGSADMIMSAMTDTAEREKRIDFVDYFSAGTAIVVQPGNPRGISDLQSMCGQRVAVETGTTQADLLRREQAQCRPGSKIIVVAEPTNDDALVQLRTGRVSALPMDYPPAKELTTSARTRAYYQLASTSQYEPGLYGIGFAKDQQVLRDTVQSALAELIRSGAYRAVLRNWNVADGAIRQASMNAAHAESSSG